MRTPRTIQDVVILLRQIQDRLEAIEKGNQDFHGRRIINAGNALNLQDYATKADVLALANLSDGPTSRAPDKMRAVTPGTRSLIEAVAHCHVTQSANTAITTGVYTTLQYNAATKDTDQIYTGGGIHVVPPVCRPLCTAIMVGSATWAANVVGDRFAVWTKNLATTPLILGYDEFSGASGGALLGPTNCCIAVDAAASPGDTYEFRVAQNSGGNLNVNGGKEYNWAAVFILP